jgi:hypothetical protein
VRVTFADPTSDLRFRFELAERMGKSVYGLWNVETEELLEPGVVHMLYPEYRNWKQYLMRKAHEAEKASEAQRNG